MKLKQSISPKQKVSNKKMLIKYAVATIAIGLVAFFGVFIYLNIGVSRDALAGTEKVVLEVNWDNDVKTAASGPNAISVSSSAFIDNGQLNAGTPKKDINLVFPGSIFNVEGIDFSIDFRRDESQGDLINRGHYLTMGMNGGKLFIRYRVDDGNSGHNQINASNIYNLPNDGNFHTYRFRYDPNTGTGEIFVDGSSVWKNVGNPASPLYINGAGNVTIGDKIDGSGKGNPLFDNMTVSDVPLTVLPIDLASFSVTAEDGKAVLNWTTASEENNDFFTIERSKDGKEFEKIGQVSGAGNSSSLLAYTFTDQNPGEGTMYYRIKQTDFDGNFSYSGIQTVDLHTLKGISIERVGPNPFSNSFTANFTVDNDDPVTVMINDMMGTALDKQEVLPVQGRGTYTFNNGSDLKAGTYIFTVIQGQHKESMRLVKKP